jgi:SAM-dependent methyltransferase
VSALQRARRVLVPGVKRVIARYAVSPAESEKVRGSVDELRGAVRGLEWDVEERLARLEPLVDELVDAVRSGHSEADQRARTLDARLHATPYIAGEPFTSFQSQAGKVVGFRTALDASAEDSPYAGFEDVFRGPADRVAQTQRPYLPLVRNHTPILDVGCGRGEFLELLRDEGIPAAGVDSDPGMVARCRASGLAVSEGDALAHLEAVEPGTLGTVFCAQVIEHLPAEALRRIFELAHRALRHDGLFIAETVNPHSLPALKMFWVDPTHHHPVFPEVSLALSGLAGFRSAFVFAPGFEDFEKARFQSNSYAVVASPAALEP